MSFIVAKRPVNSGRACLHMLIDLSIGEQVATFDDENVARAVCATLDGAEKVYRAELNRHDAESPF